MSSEQFTMQSESYYRGVVRRLRKNTYGMVGLGVLLILVLVAIFAPYIAPYDPNLPIPTPEGRSRRWQPPSERHILGTDSIGRDVLSRVIFASRVSLSVGLVATVITITIGIIIGSLAGFFGGWVDTVLMRFTDTILCFPVIFLCIALATMIRPSILNVMLIIGLVYWTRTARIVRAEFLRLREMEFSQAAVALGVRPGRIIARHLLPNAMSPIIVDATLRVAYAILMEATLSFLGVGVQEPIPSWGRMLHQATSISVLDGRAWLWVPPGIAILVTVLSINFLGDALRDALDPKLKNI